MMIDEPEDNGGRMSWTTTVGFSVVAHVIVLGVLWLILGPSKSDAPASSSRTEPPPAATTPAAAPSAAEPSAPATSAPATPPAVTPPASTRPTTNRPPAVTPPVTPPAVTTRPPVHTTPPATRPMTPPATPAATVETTDYEVAKGEGLWVIARKTGCTVAELKALNGKAADRLHTGDKIKVPVRQ